MTIFENFSKIVSYRGTRNVDASDCNKYLSDYDDCWDGGLTAHGAACAQNCHNEYYRTRTCSCNAGYVLTGSTGCRNKNECTEGGHNCHAHATCTDYTGGFNCVCKDGYTGNGSSCSDRNECADGTHTCHSHATCHNRYLHGHGVKFDCICNSGYYASGTTCYNTNECTAGGNNCHADAICTDKTPHSHGGLKFSCACKSGFTDNGYGTHCMDIDECANGEKRCDPVAMCTNTHGDHTCGCPVGYTDPNEDGTVCEGTLFL